MGSSLKRHWRFNVVGVAIYLLMTVWVLFASMVRLIEEVMAGGLDWRPIVGFGIGLLALVGVGFGAIDRDGDPDPKAAWKP